MKSMCRLTFCTLTASFIALCLWANMALAETSIRIVVLGDSLISGYGLQGGEAFPEQLQIALQADGLNVKIENAGVSGDTSAGGLSRLDWSIDGLQKPDLVIVALGANDMLRGLPVAETKKNIKGILQKLQEKDIKVLLIGMHAPLQYSLLFRNGFDKIYSDLAKTFNVPLYPFFLKDVALKADLNQADGLHPNQKGVAVMVQNLKPIVHNALKN